METTLFPSGSVRIGRDSPSSPPIILAMNASILASEGVGYALCFDKLINVTGESNLCFRPLSPAVESKAGIIWKKYQNLPKAPRKFLELLKKA